MPLIHKLRGGKMKYKFLNKYIQKKYHKLYSDWSYIQLIEHFNIR